MMPSLGSPEPCCTGSKKGKKLYFIRSYEIWAGPKEWVDKSYTLPLTKVTTTSNMQKLIGDKFGVQVDGPFPNGLNSEYFFRESESFGCHSTKRVGLLYRHDRGKGMVDGLEAIRKAREEYPDFDLVLFGWKVLPRDKNLIDKFGDIEFHLLPSYKEGMRKILSSLDIFVFPSHEKEAFGNPPMEAMACGAAVVSTDVGAIPDFSISGESAIHVKPHNVDELSNAILSLLKDEGLRQRVARRGCQDIKANSWDRTVEGFERYLDRLILAE